MQARIEKWGNSLAVRIPKLLAAETGLKFDSRIEIRAEGGTLIVTTARAKKRYSLAEMLDSIQAQQLHEVVDFGQPVGAEVW
jgi:antitoxin MazE